jgi:hypothetical protein
MYPLFIEKLLGVLHVPTKTTGNEDQQADELSQLALGGLREELRGAGLPEARVGRDILDPFECLG